MEIIMDKPQVISELPFLIRKRMYDAVVKVDFESIREEVRDRCSKGEDVSGLGYNDCEGFTFVTDGVTLIFFINGMKVNRKCEHEDATLMCNIQVIDIDKLLESSNS